MLPTLIKRIKLEKNLILVPVGQENSLFQFQLSSIQKARMPTFFIRGKDDLSQ